MQKSLDPPKPSAGDTAFAIARAGLSTIPIVGGAAVELLQLVIQSPLEKRRNAWVQQVGAKLHELEAQGFQLDTLQTNDEFISAVLHASQIALRTHQREKLEALRNAIANIALGQKPDETVQHVLLSLLDSLTAMHLRILNAFETKAAPRGVSSRGLDTWLERAVPELKDRRDVYGMLWRDLHAKGLVTTQRLGDWAPEDQREVSPRVTSLGRQLLEFITELPRNAV